MVAPSSDELGTIPDLDVFIHLGSPVNDFVYHRSFSHSLFLLALMSPIIAWLITKVHSETKRYYRRWVLLSFLVLDVFLMLKDIQAAVAGEPQDIKKQVGCGHCPRIDYFSMLSHKHICYNFNLIFFHTHIRQPNQQRLYAPDLRFQRKGFDYRIRHGRAEHRHHSDQTGIRCNGR
ncbi:metal-dependent hydrolase [Desulfosarcina variabilis]|uniref:metal-dependent hydrolase n=1 Tax=Desulfosarcina variabilis TaxID=2300 RepID=UPI003AFA1746